MISVGNDPSTTLCQFGSLDADLMTTYHVVPMFRIVDSGRRMSRNLLSIKEIAV
jgi:hypothetical protein